jgi:hypothetical protein
MQQADCMSCNTMIQYNLTGNMKGQIAVAYMLCNDPYTEVPPPPNDTEDFFSNWSEQPVWA